MDYLVVHSSKTGNTEKVAMAIFNALSGKLKDVQRVEELKGEADTYFVGFWDNHGIYSGGIVELLSGLSGEEVALFGTCGMGGSQEYFDTMVNQVEAFIPDDYEYLGAFMRAGKIPPQILEKYKQIQKVNDNPQVRMMIKAYGEGMLHPNNNDFRHAREFVEQVIGRE